MKKNNTELNKNKHNLLTHLSDQEKNFNFSEQYQYNIKQTSDENREKIN